MGLFSRKPPVSAEEFCREFYESQVFNPRVAGEDIGQVFWQTVFNSVVEADESFKKIEPPKFQEEMTVLRMELFGLAWMHKFKREEFTIAQSIFTKRYLEEEGRSEIWDAMGEYNQAIAQSATMTESGKQMDAERIAKVNLARANMFYKWAAANIGDPSAPTEEEKMLANCVVRVANRIGTDVRRSDCILVKRLTARLADRLGCGVNLNFEALFRLGAVVFGLYAGAEEAIKNLNLQR